ncbi:hypothetical protein GJV85_13330 (plasmid) [Sulfurimonas aquatica]|uniref:Uncharacterized protein n=1 Tax=Sulfurimonas aquatica TaxID=2672570 RepID=A0A975B2R0_9BACT|nr:hypothetical protein [Sulfurimonas aquatica]QSZ43152.1 hypothetical protein GJV85_13330 [Sulfurimonas aquatica]
MVNFERALFDANEALHHMGVLAADKNITLFALAFSLVITLMTLPMIIRMVAYIMEKDTENLYLPIFVSLSLLLTLFLLEAYSIILAACIFGGFIYLINRYPQYRDIKNYIDRFF